MIHEYEMRAVRRNARAQVRALARRLGLPAYDVVPEPEPATVDEAMADLQERIERLAVPLRRVEEAYRAMGATAARTAAALARFNLTLEET